MAAKKNDPVLTTDSYSGKTRPRTEAENVKYKAVDAAQASKLRKEAGMPEPSSKPAAKKPAAKSVAKPAAKKAAPAAKPAAKKAAPAKKK